MGFGVKTKKLRPLAKNFLRHDRDNPTIPLTSGDKREIFDGLTDLVECLERKPDSFIGPRRLIVTQQISW